MKRVKQSTKNRFLLLYGSQTGKAKAIAEEIADTAPQFGLAADLHCLSLTEKRFSISQESCVVFVVSTTGDGEPPSTAIKFFRRISNRTLCENHLLNLRYALLGLGDSNYSTFCQFGKQLEKTLQSLSAKPFYKTGHADEAVGIEKVAEPWIENLFPAIIQQLGFSCSVKANTYHLNYLALKLIKSSEEVDRKPNISPLNGLVKIHDLENKMASTLTEDKKPENDSIYSLFSSVEILKEKKFIIPSLPLPFLNLSYCHDKNQVTSVDPAQNTNLVYAASPLVDVKLECCKRLTEGKDVKEALELTFHFVDDQLPFEPGDSFGFICKNSEEEVTSLLERLGVQHLSSLPCRLSVAEEFSSKKRTVSHLPEYSTLGQIFTSCCDIRFVPKKVLLRVLLEYTTDETDKLCLQFLCSQEGALLYTEYLRKPSLCLLDILHAFKSCTPPVERILEYLPALKPRFYSVASSSLVDSSLFRIVFNVVCIDGGSGRCQPRKGVCTGWFHKISQNLPACATSNAAIHEITSSMSSLSLSQDFKNLHVYKRRNQFFNLPDDLNVSLIMVGPGTGVAPFVGFLQHREQQMKDDYSNTYGEMWLFYGCRYQEKDFLYREELTRLHSCGVLSHLITCFSRDELKSPEITCPRYVQDNIRRYAQDIVRIIDNGGKIFVCGDANHMAQDVFQAFVEIMETVKGIPKSEAVALIKNLEVKKRYVADVWT